MQPVVAGTPPEPTDISRLLAPRSIAVVGASQDPDKLSGRPVEYLKRFGFTGRILPVNPKNEVVQGIPAHQSIEDIDEDVDLAMIMVPSERVPEAIRACGRARVAFAIVVASGFAEIGAAGEALNEELRAAVAESGVRVLGPNCLGMISLRNGAVPTFSPVLRTHGELVPGHTAFVSQSGAFGSFLFDEVQQLRLGLSHYITTGNELDLSVSDLLGGLVRDESVQVLLTYLEGVTDGEALLEVAARAHRLDKPIIVVKSGRSAIGAEAARSHTASLAGDDAVFDSLTRARGVVRVNGQDQLLDTAQVFGPGRRARGRRLTVLSESGGAGVLMTDAAVDAGLHVLPWDEEWQRKLAAVIPAFASPRNPVDLTATLVTDPHLMDAALSTVIEHPDTDMIAVLVGNADEFSGPLIEAITRLYRKSDRPLVVVWTGGDGGPRTALREHGIPCFTDPVRAAEALGRLADYSLRPPLAAPAPPADVDAAAARRIVDRARAEGRKSLDEAESGSLVAAYGVPVVPSRVVTTPQQALGAAVEFGTAVVVKVLSDRIQHKTEFDGVRLDLRTAEDIAGAAEELLEVLRSNGEPEPRLLVQPMRAGSTELILGAKRDRAFGPIVVAGFGGVLVEILGDSALATAPTDHETAKRMLGELKGAPLFEGVRGRPELDLDAVADCTARLSWLIADLHDEIAEIDVNPLLVDAAGRGAAAVDALVLLREGGAGDGES